MPYYKDVNNREDISMESNQNEMQREIFREIKSTSVTCRSTANRQFICNYQLSVVGIEENKIEQIIASKFPNMMEIINPYSQEPQ